MKIPCIFMSSMHDHINEMKPFLRAVGRSAVGLGSLEKLKVSIYNKVWDSLQKETHC